jgi:hypothetical protein
VTKIEPLDKIIINKNLKPPALLIFTHRFNMIHVHLTIKHSKSNYERKDRRQNLHQERKDRRQNLHQVPS